MIFRRRKALNCKTYPKILKDYSWARFFRNQEKLRDSRVEAHTAHEKSLPWLQRIKQGSDSDLVSAHSIAELYAILTTLPMKPRISPIVAYDLIQRNVFDLPQMAEQIVSP